MEKTFVEYAAAFYNDNQRDNSSNLQWEHCYKSFYVARKNDSLSINFLSLNLAFYLASWGMYRGSSFLTKYDHQIHIPVIEEILKKDYDVLLGIKCSDYDADKLVSLIELQNAIKAVYSKKSEFQRPISKILVTKILLGTLGCVPAYDRYFEQAIRYNGFKNYSCNTKSINELKLFYNKYENEFEISRKKMIIQGTYIEYPQMKYLDMVFWQMGKDLERN